MNFASRIMKYTFIYDLEQQSPCWGTVSVGSLQTSPNKILVVDQARGRDRVLVWSPPNSPLDYSCNCPPAGLSIDKNWASLVAYLNITRTCLISALIVNERVRCFIKSLCDENSRGSICATYIYFEKNCDYLVMMVTKVTSEMIQSGIYRK